MNGRFSIRLLVYLLTSTSFIGPHLSALARNLREAEGNWIDPREFLHACGVVFRDEKGRPLNGDTPQDTAQFIIELLKRLHDEDIMERTEKADAAKSSMVKELFHVKRANKVSRYCGKSTCHAELTTRKLSCKDCNHERKISGQPIADCLGLSVILLDLEVTTTLGELLEHIKTSELLLDYPCPGCKKTDTTSQQAFVESLPKYLIVQAPRARYVEIQTGLSKRDTRMQSSVDKIHTSVKVPAMAMDLSFLLDGEGRIKPHQYEVFGIVEHSGR